jgi:hypothetical protein
MANHDLEGKSRGRVQNAFLSHLLPLSNPSARNEKPSSNIIQGFNKKNVKLSRYRPKVA